MDKPDYELKEYTITAVAPTGTFYTKVEARIVCNNLKLGALCLTATSNTALGSIDDKVWQDANRYDLQDAGEPGICGINIQLKNSAGTVIASTTSNSAGAYSFNCLAAGAYSVVFPASLNGATITSKNVGANRDIDGDPTQGTGATSAINLAPGQNITNIDAGYCANTMALGNRVWNDANNNGIDENESGIAAAKVSLYKDDNNDKVADGAAIATTVTDGSGCKCR